MLPQNNNPNRTIYINPNFKGQQRVGDVPPTFMPVPAIQAPPHIPANAHINPLFLEKQNKRPTIHMNPRFLLKLHQQQQMPVATEVQPTTYSKFEYCANSAKAIDELPTEEGKIICKSKNRLIREPIVKTSQKPLLVKATVQLQPLVVVTKRKLIRKSVMPTPQPVNHAIQLNTDAVESKTIITKYKLDNRAVRKKPTISTSTMSKIKRKSFVGRYALRRTSASLTQSPWKKSTTTKSPNIQSMNKKLQLLNINGLLYKSTRNKLQLKDMSNKAANVILKPKKSASSQILKPQGLTIFVRGTKYIMDPQKFKLTRVTNTEKDTTANNHNKSTICRRIDIGGFTYVSAPSAKNVLIRTSNHLARAYVNNAKQKSLHVLTKHLVKSNIPCPIYQRVGKCAAFERGKCLKVHNKQQVAICSKFLRGECVNLKCLLSHDVSLSKMPVCKFFLQGVCVRNDCPYLHKKLSNNAEVCIDFLRGFCQLADKCNKRHEFVCPELERTGSCANKNCLFCKSKLKREKFLEKISDKVKKIDHVVSIERNDNTSPPAQSEMGAKECHGKPTGIRYFIGGPEGEFKPETSLNEEERKAKDVKDDDSQETLAATEESVRKRPKLGNLPAFIPL